jgi:hypothetical protein
VREVSEEIHKRLYSVKEAGRYLGRSPWAIRHLILEKLLPAVRQGRRVMDMDRFIEKHKGELSDGNDLPPQEA